MDADDVDDVDFIFHNPLSFLIRRVPDVIDDPRLISISIINNYYTIIIDLLLSFIAVIEIDVSSI